MRMAKKGDMALIVRLCDTDKKYGFKYVGTICEVISDQYVYDQRYRVNDIILHDGREEMIRASCLIPLDPPSDSATLFAAEPADGAVRA